MHGILKRYMVKESLITAEYLLIYYNADIMFNFTTESNILTVINGTWDPLVMGRGMPGAASDGMRNTMIS